MVRCMPLDQQGSLRRWKETEVRGHLTYLSNRNCLHPTSMAVFYQSLGDFDDFGGTYQFGNNGVRYVSHARVGMDAFDRQLGSLRTRYISFLNHELEMSALERSLPAPLASVYETEQSFHHPSRGVFAVLTESAHLHFYLKVSRSLKDEFEFFPPAYRALQENFDLYNAPLVLNPTRPGLDDPDMSDVHSTSSDDEGGNAQELAQFEVGDPWPTSATL